MSAEVETAEALREQARVEARRCSKEKTREGYKPAGLHEYTDADGWPLYWRIRLKHPDGSKWIRPLHRDESGAWHLSLPKRDAKPLYRLPGLISNTGPIFVVEGEACADALVKLGLNATTSGSSSSAGKADWKPLQDTEIIIWPDADEAGVKYAAGVIGQLQALGNDSIRIIDIETLGLAAGGDCVDWLKGNSDATSDDIRRLQIVEPGRDAHGAVTRCLSEVIPERLRWLWPNRIPLGKLTMLAGDPGLGKSLVTSAIATNVTLGNVWPVDGGRCAPGSVVILSAEDDPADTLVPRLLASGANLHRIHTLDAIRKPNRDGDTVESMFDLSADIEALGVEVERIGDVRLVIIDPISAYLGGGVDSHKNSEVRGLLAPLSTLAQKHELSVLAVTHLNKGQGSAMYRTTGSLAFVAAARAAYLVAKDKDDPTRRLVIPQKTNLAPDTLALAYRVGTVETPYGWQPVIEWEAQGVEINADDALASSPGPEPDERKEVEQWLRSALAAGSRKAKEMEDEAINGFGYSKATLKRARKSIGVIAKQKPDPENKKHSYWKWNLPPEAQVRGSYPPRANKPERLEPLPINQRLTVGINTPEDPVAQVMGHGGEPEPLGLYEDGEEF